MIFRSDQLNLTRPSKVAIVATLAMLLTMTAGIAPTAAHDLNLEPLCAAGELCYFKNSNFRGAIYGVVNDDNFYGVDNKWELTHHEVGGRINDRQSSVDNDGISCGSRHFLDSDYENDHFWLVQDAFIAVFNDKFDDELSSHDWCGDRGHH